MSVYQKIEKETMAQTIDDPRGHLGKLKKFYTNRPRDILSYCLPAAYNDTDFKKRFNNALF